MGINGLKMTNKIILESHDQLLIENVQLKIDIVKTTKLAAEYKNELEQLKRKLNDARIILNSI